MKDWNDFLPPDDDDNFEGFNDENQDNDKLSKVQKVHRMMFINDIERRVTDVIPLDPIEFYDLFGKPTEEDMQILTQCLLSEYMKDLEIYDRWGLEWMYEIMTFNETQEEYEICAIVRDMIKDRPMDSLKKVLNENI